MIRRFLLGCLCACACASVSGCGDGGAEGGNVQDVAPPVATGALPPGAGGIDDSRPVVQSDADIAALVYTDAQRTPTGFYTESIPVFDGYVVTTHLLSTDVGVSTIPYELCTDDWHQAYQWSENANASSGRNAALVGNEVTERYFEFDRVVAGNPSGYRRERVYRCAYLDRSGVDVRSDDGAAGRLNVRPLDATALRQAVEYSWQFTAYNNFGGVVLGSVGGSDANALTHSLYIATLQRATISMVCDTITVIEWRHSAQRDTGELTLSIRPLWRFRSRQSDGVTAACN